MSVPAGLMQALQQGGGAGPAGGAPGGFPASIQVGGGSGDSGSTKSDGDWEQDLHAAIAALRELAGDAEDHVETNAIDKCIAALSALTAKRQTGAEAALGTTAAHKAMGRAYS
jgi:hypothetical protein